MLIPSSHRSLLHISEGNYLTWVQRHKEKRNFHKSLHCYLVAGVETSARRIAAWRLSKRPVSPISTNVAGHVFHGGQSCQVRMSLQMRSVVRALQQPSCPASFEGPSVRWAKTAAWAEVLSAFGVKLQASGAAVVFPTFAKL